MAVSQLSPDQVLGKILFERVWVSAPASTTASDGLGPYYNAVSCDTCHPAGGGGSLTSGESVIPSSLVVHFPAVQANFTLGSQWQPYATQGLEAELTGVSLAWETDYLQYGSGERIARHRPFITLADPNTVLPDSTVISLRLAPALQGLSALASEAGGMPMGLQGNRKNIEEQVALALAMDMGLGNPLFPGPEGDCTPVQHVCMQVALDGQTGNSPEIGEDIVRLMIDYLGALEPPQSGFMEDDPGYSVFSQLGCDTCHIQQSQQGLHSWTDAALHDMGEGLADRTLLGETVPTRWRTAPLWGLAEALASGSVSLLHDGRAATVEQAILWHEGEALDSRDRYLALPEAQRGALLDFLSGL